MSTGSAAMSSAARTGPGFRARTARGFTLKRFAIFCGIIAMASVGHSISVMLMPAKTLADAAQAFTWEYAYLFVLFGTVWVTVVAVDNRASTRTVPRVLALVGAVAAGLIAGNVLIHRVLAPSFMPHMDDETLLKQISAAVLWSHVVGAGVLGYYFLTREEEVTARLHAGRSAAGRTSIATSPRRGCR